MRNFSGGYNSENVGEQTHYVELQTENETVSTDLTRNIKINYRYYPENIFPQTATIIINVTFNHDIFSPEYEDYLSQSNFSTQYADYQLISDDGQYDTNIEETFSEIRLIDNDDDRLTTDAEFDLETNNSFEVTNQSSKTDMPLSASGGNHTLDSLKSQTESISFLQLFFITFSILMLMYIIGLFVCGYIAKKYCRHTKRMAEHIEMVDLF
jgi:hypothetical protein